jgi:hypothetical protein
VEEDPMKPEVFRSAHDTVNGINLDNSYRDIKGFKGI